MNGVLSVEMPFRPRHVELLLRLDGEVGLEFRGIVQCRLEPLGLCLPVGRVSRRRGWRVRDGHGFWRRLWFWRVLWRCLGRCLGRGDADHAQDACLLPLDERSLGSGQTEGEDEASQHPPRENEALLGSDVRRMTGRKRVVGRVGRGRSGWRGCLRGGRLPQRVGHGPHGEGCERRKHVCREAQRAVPVNGERLHGKKEEVEQDAHQKQAQAQASRQAVSFGRRG